MAELTPTTIQSFIDYLKFEKRYSPHTIISYRTDLNEFAAYINQQYGRFKLNQITHALVRGWLAELKETGLRQSL
jgi:integrase/recombinase XerC